MGWFIKSTSPNKTSMGYSTTVTDGVTMATPLAIAAAKMDHHLLKSLRGWL